jgi:hypothetical protein
MNSDEGGWWEVIASKLDEFWWARGFNPYPSSGGLFSFPFSFLFYLIFFISFFYLLCFFIMFSSILFIHLFLSLLLFFHVFFSFHFILFCLLHYFCAYTFCSFFSAYMFL